MVAQQIAPAPARDEAAEAGLGVDQRLEEGRGGVGRAEAVDQQRDLHAAADRRDQGVADAAARTVVLPDIIEDAKRFLGAVDQARSAPRAARGPSGSRVSRLPATVSGSMRVCTFIPLSRLAGCATRGEAETAIRAGELKAPPYPLEPARMLVSRLSLTDFRSYADAVVAPGPGFVILTGENGAGKTNVLEAVSLLVAGPRAARRAALPKWRGAAAPAASRSRRGSARGRDRHRHRADARRSGARSGSTARRPRPTRCRNGCRCCG